jgi:hypothetical protein
MHEGMERDEIRRAIQRLDGLSSPSASLDRILELAADCESDVSELTAAIESDPAVTSHVLWLSNSAYFGVAKEVTTLARAVVVIGWQNVLGLATCAALAPAFRAQDRRIGRRSCVLAPRPSMGVMSSPCGEPRDGAAHGRDPAEFTLVAFGLPGALREPSEHAELRELGVHHTTVWLQERGEAVFSELRHSRARRSPERRICLMTEAQWRSRGACGGARARERNRSTP